MNVRTICLAILHEGEASGYEIRRLSTEGECAYFVEASYSSIYPALVKLEDESLVTSRVEVQDGRPSKKVYAITDTGRSVFINSLFEDLSPDVFRSEFLLFARFAGSLPPELVRKRMCQRVAQLSEKITDLEGMLAENTHPAEMWIINHGLACLRVARDHLAAHMGELVEIAQPNTVHDEAAE